MNTIEALCRILLDENRITILGLLAVSPRSTGELQAALPKMKPKNLVRHLDQLSEADLISLSATGNYSLNVKAIQAMKKDLFINYDADVKLVENEDRNAILLGFVQNWRLTHLPLNHSKKLVILDWLVQNFEPETRYSEYEVNQILDGHQIDYANLRRALVDYGFMSRHGGQYWRTTLDIDAVLQESKS